jgi:hypothetical protein
VVKLTLIFFVIVGCIPSSARAGVTCPPPPTFHFPQTTTNVPTNPPSQAELDLLIALLYDHYHNYWVSRISLPDIASSSSAQVWTETSEFWELVKSQVFLPNVVQGLRNGDFRLVPVIECITKIDSVLLYPNPMPPIGQFGMQDVAHLWGLNGGQLYETQCRGRCAGDAACEQGCTDMRHRAWGP